MDAIAMEYWGKGVTAFLAGLCAKYRLAGFGRTFDEPIALPNGRCVQPMGFELRPAASHRTDAKTDPRTQLTRSPLGPPQAWTAFRAVASRQNGPPVQYWRQRQLSQLQQDI